jgi:hypothetical protein
MFLNNSEVVEEFSNKFYFNSEKDRKAWASIILNCGSPQDEEAGAFLFNLFLLVSLSLSG